MSKLNWVEGLIGFWGSCALQLRPAHAWSLTWEAGTRLQSLKHQSSVVSLLQIFRKPKLNFWSWAEFPSLEIHRWIQCTLARSGASGFEMGLRFSLEGFGFLRLRWNGIFEGFWLFNPPAALGLSQKPKRERKEANKEKELQRVETDVSAAEYPDFEAFPLPNFPNKLEALSSAPPSKAEPSSTSASATNVRDGVWGDSPLNPSKTAPASTVSKPAALQNQKKMNSPVGS